jgi:hypothetical protein
VRDTYGVEIKAGQDDALLLAVVVCIDQMTHDSGSNTSALRRPRLLKARNVIGLVTRTAVRPITTTAAARIIAAIVMATTIPRSVSCQLCAVASHERSRLVARPETQAGASGGLLNERPLPSRPRIGSRRNRDH